MWFPCRECNMLKVNFQVVVKEIILWLRIDG